MKIEVSFLFVLSLAFIQLLEPFKIFEFNFWKRPESQGKAKLHIKATNDGTVRAVVSWYKCWYRNYYFL